VNQEEGAALGTTRASKGFRGDIDGLRTLATIMVVGYHVGLPGFGGAFVGIDLFFVISGYLIVGLLLREHSASGRIRWSGFFARRARRLVPAAIVLQLGVLVLGAVALSPLGERQDLGWSSMYAVTSTANFYYGSVEPTANYTDPLYGKDVLIHTWSLSLEEQFYLLLPVVVFVAALLLRRLSFRAAMTFAALVLSVMSLWLAYLVTDSHPLFAKYSPPTRAYEFGIGALLALAPAVYAPAMRRLAPTAGLLILALLMLRPAPLEDYPGTAALVPCLAASLIIWGGENHRGMVHRGLSFSPLARTAPATYSWYLWHWPLLILADRLYIGTLPLHARLLVAAASLVIAGLVYLGVERRFHQRGDSLRRTRRRPKATLVAAVMSLGLAAAVGYASIRYADAEGGTDRWQAAGHALSDLPPVPAGCRPDSVVVFLPARSEECPLTEGGTTQPTIAIWGDSHAWMLMPALEAAARRSEVNATAWVAAACPPFLPSPDETVADAPAKFRGAMTGCVDHNRQALAHFSRAAARSPNGTFRVVVAARWAGYQTSDPISFNDPLGLSQAPREVYQRLLDPGLADAVSYLTSIGVQVDVVAPVPEMSRVPGYCLPRRWLRPSCDVSAAVESDYLEVGTRWLAEHLPERLPGSLTIDLYPALCGRTTCPAQSGQVVNYYDSLHVSATRSRSLWPYVLPSMEALRRAS
jgi:peptidoglycan/LPS O-acetylase OafA/YrhL